MRSKQAERSEAGVSDCLGGQVAAANWFRASRAIALRIDEEFAGEGDADDHFGLSGGLQPVLEGGEVRVVLATMRATMKRMLRTYGTAAADASGGRCAGRLSSARGARPTRLADGAVGEAADLGHFGEQGRARTGPTPGIGGEKVSARARRGIGATTAAMSPSRLESSFARRGAAGDAAFADAGGQALLALAYRRRSSGRSGRGGRRARRAAASVSSGRGRMSGLVGLAKWAITAASMGSVFARSPSALGKGPHVGRVDDDEGQAGCREGGGDDGFVAAGRLHGHGLRRQGRRGGR